MFARLLSRPIYRWQSETAYLPSKVAGIIASAPRIWRNRLVSRPARTARIMPEAWFDNFSNSRDSIVIGDHSVVRGEFQIFRHGGRIEIGQWCFVGPGSRIWSAQSVVLGDRVLISHDVDIHDTNSHPLDAARRAEQYRRMLSFGRPSEEPDVDRDAIVIGDDVWVCFGAKVMKGVNIGQGAIIAAGAVVTGDVEPWTVVGGNPARVLRRVSPAERSRARA